METVSEGVRQLSIQGSKRRIKESEASRKRTTICNYCDGEHSAAECILEISVPKGAYVNPRYIVTCGICGLWINNDLLCKECKGEVPGRLFPQICEVCGDVCVDHSPDSCPNRDRHVRVGDYGPLPPDWAPSSPPYCEELSSP